MQVSLQPVHRVSGDYSIGAILVDAGKLTLDEAEPILRLQKERSLRFGEAAIQLGILSEDDVRFALARQYRYPYLLKGDTNVSDELVAALQPFSPQVEALRALRSQLIMRWFTGEPERRALAIISPGSKEGRSYLAANMAVVFSQLGERTLLIDGDMRHPNQHKMFGIENRSGLSSILSNRGDASTIQRIPSFIDLSILPAGPTPPNPQELLGRPMFNTFMANMADEFDVIIVDTPPAAKYADANIVSLRTGGALIAARQNRTSLRESQQLAGGLTDLGVLMVGSVLSNF